MQEGRSFFGQAILLENERKPCFIDLLHVGEGDSPTWKRAKFPCIRWWVNSTSPAPLTFFQSFRGLPLSLSKSFVNSVP